MLIDNTIVYLLTYIVVLGNQGLWILAVKKTIAWRASLVGIC